MATIPNVQIIITASVPPDLFERALADVEAVIKTWNDLGPNDITWTIARSKTVGE